MAIKLRSRREIELLRNAGKVVAEVLLKLQEVARPGISTAELDRIAEEITVSHGGIALFKGVKSPYAKKPFPGVICASINEQVVHGIPSEDVRLKNADIISVDYGIRLGGYCGDAAVTIGIGKISPTEQKLLNVTKDVLDLAISMCAPGLKWSQIAAQMQKHAESNGFSVVRDFVGHGIGTEMHEDPRVPNFASAELRSHDILLAEGMILAIEPMINAGSMHVKMLSDGWTVVTRDGKCSAHFEHTVAITANGCEVLTA
ncbi:MAG: type I methionyl aminopeptidase [Planctomycetes bacterium GWC2_49_10]|nr:MAG: type I methionyl aminopeptidase [Planctomycetes bacterium GWC2_49_10]